MDHNARIAASWEANAGNWIATIDHAEIESRNLVTNEAILQAVVSAGVKSVLDIGCGEGWLTRAMQEAGMNAFGVDAVPALIENAIHKGGAHYAVATFRELGEGKLYLPVKTAAAVINFALLDELDSAFVLQRIHLLVQPNAKIFIQTLHPLTMAMQGDYTSGWKEGSWNGLKRDFTMPYEWYFRTLADWTTLFHASRLKLDKILEPLHPVTKVPASIIFQLEC